MTDAAQTAGTEAVLAGAHAAMTSERSER
jgi:hypothetical protein